MKKEGFVDNSAGLIEAALKREAIISTALEHGIAFPHVRGVEGGGLTLAVATSKKGFKFNPDSRKLTRIVFFMVIPTAASAFYLKLISGLTQTFLKKGTREKLLEITDQNKLWKTLLSTTKSSIS